MLLAVDPASVYFAVPSLAFLFRTQAQRGPLEKKVGLSEVSQCTSGAIACQLAELRRTVWAAQDLRVASGARIGLAAWGGEGGRSIEEDAR